MPKKSADTMPFQDKQPSNLQQPTTLGDLEIQAHIITPEKVELPINTPKKSNNRRSRTLKVEQENVELSSGESPPPRTTRSTRRSVLQVTQESPTSEATVDVLVKPSTCKGKTSALSSIQMMEESSDSTTKKSSIQNAQKLKQPSVCLSFQRKRVVLHRSPTTSHLGLTPKEKGYLISTCQKRTNRYLKLKAHAERAMEKKQVYIVYGHNPVIRRALNSRGWVEKIQPQNMNLTKLYNLGAKRSDINYELERMLLSNLVEKHTPNFLWKVKDYTRESLNLNSSNYTIINKLKMDTLWTTKQGLCTTTKNTNWFKIENVSDIVTPRTYNAANKDDIDEFTADFILTACTCLLKWQLQMNENKKHVYSNNGNISTNILVFALNRCKEYIFRKQNKDLDINMPHITTRSGNVFLKNFYKLIKNEDSFEESLKTKVPLYNAYAKILLVEIQKYRPQLKCEGIKNVWIVKPGHCSRGRGIRIASNLTEIYEILTQACQRQVIQKYIENPLLIHETKFDIRQYYLVTDTFPLTIWVYKDCYLKFSSQKYTLNNFHRSIHLTNNAVQSKCKNCKDRHPELPFDNMWSLNRYKEYLKSIKKSHIWDQLIYPSMKKCIIGVMLSSQDSMSPCKNRFELYGCDFVLDENYRPWLIEINSCPALEPTTRVTKEICANVVEDIIKVVIDRPTLFKASTGKFECAYRQPYTNPLYIRPDFIVQGNSLPLGYFCKSDTNQSSMDEDVEVDGEFDIQTTFKHLKSLYTDNSPQLEMYSPELKASNSEDNVISDESVSNLHPKAPSTVSISSTNSNCSHSSKGVEKNNSRKTIVTESKSICSNFSKADLKTITHQNGDVKRSLREIELPVVKNKIEMTNSLNIAESMIQTLSKKISLETSKDLLTELQTKKNTQVTQ